MSVAVSESLQTLGPDSSKQSGLAKALGHWLALAIRCAIGVWMCTQFLTSLILVGWTFRWMRSRAWQGWWKRGAAPEGSCFCDFACTLGPTLAGAYSPRWFFAERAAEIWAAPRADGRPPGFWTRLRRLPAILIGSLAANVAQGLAALACTLVITLPGTFLMLAGWKYGWDNSFFKGYEQTYIGRIVFLIGAFTFVGAMIYAPMAWAHMAAAGDPRAFFQGRLVRKLVRARLGLSTLLAALFVLGNMLVMVAWARIGGITSEMSQIEDYTPTQLAAFTRGYVLNTCYFVFPIYVGLHLLAARVYQGALLKVLAREPRLADDLPPSTRDGLQALELIPTDPLKRRHPIVAVVLGTTKRGTNAVLWVALFVLWFMFVMQMMVMEFLHHHEFLTFLNPVLVHLPCPRWIAP